MPTDFILDDDTQSSGDSGEVSTEEFRVPRRKVTIQPNYCSFNLPGTTRSTVLCSNPGNLHPCNPLQRLGVSPPQPDHLQGFLPKANQVLLAFPEFGESEETSFAQFLTKNREPDLNARDTFDQPLQGYSWKCETKTLFSGSPALIKVNQVGISIFTHGHKWFIDHLGPDPEKTQFTIPPDAFDCEDGMIHVVLKLWHLLEIFNNPPNCLNEPIYSNKHDLIESQYMRSMLHLIFSFFVSLFVFCTFVILQVLPF